jgi:ferric-dicitrate binding protein FerR (iron transport regulator)
MMADPIEAQGRAPGRRDDERAVREAFAGLRLPEGLPTPAEITRRVLEAAARRRRRRARRAALVAAVAGVAALALAAAVLLALVVL